MSPVIKYKISIKGDINENWQKVKYLKPTKKEKMRLKRTDEKWNDKKPRKR